jgi:hypothetical protein
VAGPLAVHDVRLTSRYPEGCRTTDPAGCLTSDGDAIVVMALRAPPGQAEQIMDAITDQAVESTIDDGSGEPLSASIIRSTSTSDNVEVAYTFLGVENPATLTLYWPGNPPITLNV